MGAFRRKREERKDSMSYVWMVLIIVGWFVWALLAVADVYNNADDFTLRGIIDAIRYSDIFISWVSVSVFVLFFASLFIWIASKI